MPKAVDRVGRSDWAGLSSGILAALLAAYAAYYGTSSDLTSFPDRVVGFAILAGVDPSRRLGTYFVMVAMAVGALLCVHYFARWLMQRLPGWHFGWRSRVENSLINTLCAISGVALVASVVTNHLKPSFAFVLPLCGVALLSTLTVARRLTMRRAQWRFLRRLTLWDTMTPMLFLLWACVFAVGVIFNLDQPPKWWFYPLAWMPAVLYIATYGVMATRRPGQPSPKLRRAFALGASPLLLFPFLCPVANELQFTLTQRHPTSPRAIALAFLSVLIVASVTGFVLALRGRLRFRPSKLAIWFCFPVVIASESWLSRYNHQLAALGEPIGLDQLLHLGERVTPVEQLVHFGKLPFVDLWPAHGLSDYLGAVYAWVNGFHPFEIAAWDGLLPALVRLLAFTTLAVVSTPFLAFATVLLLPADAFFAPPTHVYDFPLLGVPLLLLWAQRRPSRWRYAVLGSAITLSCFWMPAAGVACTVSAVTLLLLGLVSANQWREPAQKLVAFAAAALFLFFLYPVVLLVRHRSLGDTLQLIAGYIQSDPLIGGRPTIINQLDWLAFFQYVLLPSIGVGYLLVLIRRSFDRRPLDERQLVLSSLGLISMVLFARTLTRHGLIEGFQPLFFPFLGAAACFWSAGWRASPKELSTEAGFFGLFALYLMFFPSPQQKAIWCKPFLFHSWTKGEPRAVGNTQPYAALKRLFDSEMKPRDTFLNLLNAPLLYTVLDREVPDSFFLPVMFYATDSVQDIYLKRIRAFDSDRVPFALLPGNAGMTEVDGMPAPLQSYRLAEHVYRNYVPLGVVDGWETWVSRTRWERARAAVSEVKLPFREVASFFQQSLDASLDADGLSLRAGVGDTQIHHFLDVPKLHFGAVRSHHALRFRYRSTRAGPLQVFFRFSGRDYNEADSSQVAIAAGGNAWQEAWVPVPLQNRGGAALEDIRLDPPNATEMVLRDFELVFGKPFDIRRQSVKMRMLPFVWGNFDSKSAVRNTAVLEEIALPESAVRGFTHLSFPIQPQVDKTSGNYLHLCISLPPPPPPNKAESDTVDRTTGWKKAGKLKVQYGKSPQGTIEFDLVRPLEVGRALLQEYTNGCKDYLVRLSSQWAWMAQPVDQLVLESSVPIRLRAASIRKGD